MKLNHQQLEAVARLLTTDDFKVFLGALGIYSERIMEKFVYAQSDDIHNKQGQCQAVSAIAKAIHTAPDTLKTIKARGNQQ